MSPYHAMIVAVLVLIFAIIGFNLVNIPGISFDIPVLINLVWKFLFLIFKDVQRRTMRLHIWKFKIVSKKWTKYNKQALIIGESYILGFDRTEENYIRYYWWFDETGFKAFDGWAQLLQCKEWSLFWIFIIDDGEVL